MRYFPLLSLTVVVFLLGCSTHYYRRNSDSVNIYLIEKNAQSVFFASSLDNFARHRTTRIDSKTWVIEMPPGREFRYFYIVDGQTFIPPCPVKERDDFGSENCIYLPEM